MKALKQCDGHMKLVHRFTGEEWNGEGEDSDFMWSGPFVCEGDCPPDLESSSRSGVQDGVSAQRELSPSRCQTQERS